MRQSRWAAVLFAIAVVAASPVRGQSVADSILEARTTAVAAELRCPVCQGLSIQDSPSELSQEMRGMVRDQLRAGKTPSEIKAFFVSKYGEWILLTPNARGFNLLLYILPFALLLGGMAVIVVLVRRWTHAAETVSHPPTDSP